jgi:hypothetical protein
MRVQVTFRVNTETGEVEFFQVDDTGQTRRLADHDAAHEQIALAIADVIDPQADVSEVIAIPGRAVAAHPVAPVPDAARRREGLEQGSAP